MKMNEMDALTVKELIEQLQQIEDQNAEVVFEDMRNKISNVCELTVDKAGRIVLYPVM